MSLRPRSRGRHSNFAAPSGGGASAAIGYLNGSAASLGGGSVRAEGVDRINHGRFGVAAVATSSSSVNQFAPLKTDLVGPKAMTTDSTVEGAIAEHLAAYADPVNPAIETFFDPTIELDEVSKKLSAFEYNRAHPLPQEMTDYIKHGVRPNSSKYARSNLRIELNAKTNEIFTGDGSNYQRYNLPGSREAEMMRGFPPVLPFRAKSGVRTAGKAMNNQTVVGSKNYQKKTHKTGVSYVSFRNTRDDDKIEFYMLFFYPAESFWERVKTNGFPYALEYGQPDDMQFLMFRGTDTTMPGSKESSFTRRDIHEVKMFTDSRESIANTVFRGVDGVARNAHDGPPGFVPQNDETFTYASAEMGIAVNHPSESAAFIFSIGLPSYEKERVDKIFPKGGPDSKYRENYAGFKLGTEEIGRAAVYNSYICAWERSRVDKGLEGRIRVYEMEETYAGTKCGWGGTSFSAWPPAYFDINKVAPAMNMS